MSDKYYRGLKNFLNDTKYKLQLTSMTLKIDENKNNITRIKNDISRINNISSDISNNSNEINYIKSNITKSYLKIFIIFYFIMKKNKLIQK